MKLPNIPLSVYLLSGGALAAFLWLREHDARVRAEGRAETLAERVDSLRAVADSALVAVAVADSVASTQKVVIEAQQHQLETVAVAARRQTQVAVASLRETLDSAQKTMLDQVEAGYQQQLAAKDSMFAAQVRLTQLANGQVAQRDSALAKIQQASAVVYDAWQVEKKRASPGLVKKVVGALPVVAASVLVTWAVVH